MENFKQIKVERDPLVPITQLKKLSTHGQLCVLHAPIHFPPPFRLF